MPILVTGATGLVGNNVTRLLLERGEAVRVLARSKTNSATWMCRKGVSSKVEL